MKKLLAMLVITSLVATLATTMVSAEETTTTEFTEFEVVESTTEVQFEAFSATSSDIKDYTWDQVKDNKVSGITVTKIDGGFKLVSKPNDRWTDIRLTISGDVFKIIEYSSTQTTDIGFQTRNLNRGETKSFRIWEATLWLQDPLPVNYNWDQVKNNGISSVKIGALDRGFTLRSESGGTLRDINLTLSGDIFGTIQYSSTQTTTFQTVTLKRGETKTIRMFEATLWLQKDPRTVTAIAFNTGSLRRADSNGYGWIFSPGEPISFVVPSNQGIKEIQAHDDRDGKNRTFKPGQTAYVGRDGATIWFNTAKTKETGVTRYSFSSTARVVIRGDIDGKDGITIQDALEVLKFLAKMNCALYANGTNKRGTPAWEAAFISDASQKAFASNPGTAVPTIQDALEILKNLAKMDNLAGTVTLIE